MNESKFQKRHRYPVKDSTVRSRKFRWFKRKLKRLSGARNDVHIAAYYPVIIEYMLRKTKLSTVDLNALTYVSRLNRTVCRNDFIEAPNKCMDRMIKSQIKRLIDNGYLERWEGHNMNYGRQIQYKLTVKARSTVNELDQLLLRQKKIPLDERITDHDFVTPRSQLVNYRRKVNWYLAIIDFNKRVDEENTSN